MSKSDRTYDAKTFRNWLTERGREPVIPPDPTRKSPQGYDSIAYESRNLIERMFYHLKNLPRVATRYDKRVDTNLATVLIAATLIWRLN